MATATVKEQVREIVEQLPDDATWEEVAYRLYRRRELEAGHRDLEEGRAHSHEEVKRRFLGE